MIAYEIQLRYVIRDKILSKTKFGLGKNPRKIFFGWEKIFVGKKLVSDKMSCLGQINAYHH